MSEPSEQHPDLPTDPDAFFGTDTDVPAMESTGANVPAALHRLGAPPFAKSKFPFVGFLASVYEHLADHARGRNGRAS